MDTAVVTAYAACLREHRSVFAGLERLQGAVEAAAQRMARSLESGGKILLCGNGGSAADCQHLAAELTGRFVGERPPLAALSLTTDTSALTCIGNDYAFADVFRRQLLGLARRGDCLVGISTSGNSENVVRAFESARALGVATIGLLGRDGGHLAPLSDVAIVVDARTTARIQEAHIFIGHTLCGLVERALGYA